MIALNPSSAFSVNCDGSCLIYINNERFIFSHSMAMRLLQKIFEVLTEPLEWPQFLSSFDSKIDRNQLVPLLEQFIQLKLLLVLETENTPINYMLKYIENGKVHQKFKSVYFASESLDTKDLAEKTGLSLLDIKTLSLKECLELQSGPSETLVVVIFSPHEFSNIFEVNRIFKNLKICWLAIEVSDTEIKLGPVFNFTESFCFNCFYLRLLARAPNRETEMKFSDERNTVAVFRKKNIGSLFTELISLELEKILVDPSRTMYLNGLRNYNFDQNKFYFANLIQSSVCEVCFPIVEESQPSE